MVWRGSNTLQDRILACLPYLVPILEVLMFGSFLFALVPPLRLLFLPLQPLAAIYFYPIAGMAVIPLVVFFGLYLGVVQNHSLSHFIRFNTIQALLIAVFAWLCGELLKLFGISKQLLFGGFAGATQSLDVVLVGVICSALFIVVVAASIYAIVQSLRGQYAEMPLISEAAYSQVR